MAKKGDLARQKVAEIIVKAFSDMDAYVATVDKKIYVNVQDGPGGEVCQFAIAMTMPKTPVSAASEVTSSSGAWADAPTSYSTTSVTSTPAPSTKLSEADQAKVNDLMRELGLM